MDVNRIKYEHGICHGCLSTDRKTTVLGHFNEVLSAISLMKQTTFCWECMKMYKNLIKFQNQVKLAQETLSQTNLSYYHTLSTLTNSYKDYYDNEFSEEPFNLELKSASLIKNENLSLDSVIKTNDCDDVFTDDYLNDSNYYQDTSDLTDISPTIKEKKIKNQKQLKNKSNKNDRRILLKKNMNNWKNIKQEYKSYAIVITKDNWEKPHSQYFKEVRLNEKEMERSFLINERKRKKDLPLHCKMCSLTYSRQIDLDRHTNLNHHKPSSPYKCLHCNETTPSMDSLTTHWLTHSVYYSCALCAVCVFPCSLSLHLSRCHVTQYNCTSCVQGFSSLASFSEHYNKNHPFVCDYCKKKCALRSVLEKHMKNHHTPHSCETCSRSFESYRLYRAHCREFHPDVLYSVVRPEECYCVECDVQFVSVALYKRHLSAKHRQRNNKVKKVACPDCGKAFTKPSDMMLHYNFAHVKITKYHCDLCDKYFLKMFGLRTHMERVHLKLPTPKNKICDLCGRAFQSKSVLENHRRTHTGERPFRCGSCPAAFAQKGALTVHQRKQHNTN